MLLEYLVEHFLTRESLLKQACLSGKDFESFQSHAMMPQCSYKLEVDLSCTSFFGQHEETSAIEFYAKGYVEWLALIKQNTNVQKVRTIFDDRYRFTIGALEEKGFQVSQSSSLDNMSEHLESEWGYFLDGTYGLCTKLGLPEDIATKELAIILINGYLEKDKLSDQQYHHFEKAVDLLDSVSSFFAPHERYRSSRKRLIDDIRSSYLTK